MPFFQHDGGARHLAKSSVWNAVYRCLAHRRMLVDRILYLRAANIFSAANYDVFGAIQNNQESKIIQQAQISGVEPAIFQHFR